MTRIRRAAVFFCVLLSVSTAACRAPQPQSSATETAPAPGPSTQPAGDPVARGQYLVTLGGCHDCHSPKVFGPAGPEPDTARLLSGHPAGEKVPAVPANVIGPTQWGALGNNHFTAWAGPWGVSFTANLTPDQATGLGSWTEGMFIKALRTGKHQGEGRPILPPMPWQMVGKMTDADLAAVFAYLRTLPPITNAVPEPIPPADAPK